MQLTSYRPSFNAQSPCHRLFFFVVLLLSLAQPSSSFHQCRSRCLLRFCTLAPPPLPVLPLTPRLVSNNSFYLRPNRSPLTPLICSQIGSSVTLLTNVSIAEISVRPANAAKFIPLSRYKPAPFERFRSNYLVPIASRDGYGVHLGRRPIFREGLFLEGACLSIRLSGWNSLKKNGLFKKKRVIPKSSAQCLSFTPITSKVFIQLSYFSASEYDMIVFVPSRNPPEELSALKPGPTEHGGVFLETKDSIEPQRCGVARWRRNTVVFPPDSTQPRGRYQVIILKRDSCDRGRDLGNLGLELKSVGSADVGFTMKAKVRRKAVIGGLAARFLLPNLG